MADTQFTVLDHTRLEKKDDNEECARAQGLRPARLHIFQLLELYT